MHIYRFEPIPERAPSGEHVLRLPRRKECTKKGRRAAAWPGLQKYVKAIFFRKTFEIELWYWIMIYVAFFNAKVHVSIGRIVSEEFRKKGMTRNAFIFKGAGQKCFGRMLNTIEGCRLNPLRNNLQKSLVCLAWVSRFASSFQTKLRWSWWSDNRFYPIHADNPSHCKKIRKKMEKKTETTFLGKDNSGEKVGKENVLKKKNKEEQDQTGLDRSARSSLDPGLERPKVPRSQELNVSRSQGP